MHGGVEIMAEEYILLKDLNKAAKEFDLDKTTMNIISIEVPTHSFESFRENELKKDFEANLLDGDKLEDCGESMLNARYVWGWLKYLCQHFKKAEGDYVFSSSVSSDIYGDSFIYLPEDVNNLEYKDVIVSLEIQVLDKKVK